MKSHALWQRFTLPMFLRRALALGLILAIVFAGSLAWDFPPKQFALKLGDVSRVRINAPRAITFESQVKTKEAQDKAAADIADVYDPPDPQIGQQQLTRAQNVYNFLDALRHDPYMTF